MKKGIYYSPVSTQKMEQTAKQKGIAEAERWRRSVVAKEATAGKKLAKPDILEKTKIVHEHESKYFIKS